MKFGSNGKGGPQASNLGQIVRGGGPQASNSGQIVRRDHRHQIWDKQQGGTTGIKFGSNCKGGPQA